jgi:hypothetical protein
MRFLRVCGGGNFAHQPGKMFRKWAGCSHSGYAADAPKCRRILKAIQGLDAMHP